ncbi:Uncharacterised protein [Chlamydia trachomatis]|nr:Uncharacterised protein [Chlamydia trachomatis]
MLCFLVVFLNYTKKYPIGDFFRCLLYRVQFSTGNGLFLLRFAYHTKYHSLAIPFYTSIFSMIKALLKDVVDFLAELWGQNN